MKLNVSLYYYYRELCDSHLLKDERKIVEKTDYHMFNAVASFTDELNNPRVEGVEGNHFLKMQVDKVGGLLPNFKVLVDSIQNVIKQGATQADNSSNRILFLLRLQSLMLLDVCNSHIERSFTDYVPVYLNDLKDLLKKIKTMDGMKRLFTRFLSEFDRAHKKWYGSPFIDFAPEEMFSKSSSSKKEASKGKTPDSKGKTDRPASPALKKK